MEKCTYVHLKLFLHFKLRIGVSDSLLAFRFIDVANTTAVRAYTRFKLEIAEILNLEWMCQEDLGCTGLHIGKCRQD